MRATAANDPLQQPPNLVVPTTQDPSGYPWELVYKPDSVEEPFREISLLVSNLDKSIKFYCEGLGMKTTIRKSTDDFSQARRCDCDAFRRDCLSCAPAVAAARLHASGCTAACA